MGYGCRPGAFKDIRPQKIETGTIVSSGTADPTGPRAHAGRNRAIDFPGSSRSGVQERPVPRSNWLTGPRARQAVVLETTGPQEQWVPGSRTGPQGATVSRPPGPGRQKTGLRSSGSTRPNRPSGPGWSGRNKYTGSCCCQCSWHRRRCDSV